MLLLELLILVISFCPRLVFFGKCQKVRRHDGRFDDSTDEDMMSDEKFELFMPMPFASGCLESPEGAREGLQRKEGLATRLCVSSAASCSAAAQIPSSKNSVPSDCGSPHSKKGKTGEDLLDVDSDPDFAPGRFIPPASMATTTMHPGALT